MVVVAVVVYVVVVVVVVVLLLLLLLLVTLMPLNLWPHLAGMRYARDQMMAACAYGTCPHAGRP